jgi:hypothetical protein
MKPLSDPKKDRVLKELIPPPHERLPERYLWVEPKPTSSKQEKKLHIE